MFYRLLVFFKETTSWLGKAGIVDGEGTITICCQIRKGRPSPAYRPYVMVTNTNPDIVSPFYTMWGGGVYLSADSRIEKKWADSYAWYCQQSRLVEFLESMLPFLRAKKRQAELVLRFVASRKSFKRSFAGAPGWSSLKGSLPLGLEEISHREALCREIQGLNAKSKVFRARIS